MHGGRGGISGESLSLGACNETLMQGYLTDRKTLLLGTYRRAMPGSLGDPRGVDVLL